MNNSVKAILLDSDRRSSPRHETSELAKTLPSGQLDATTCLVRDISETGVRIALADEDCFVPKRLKLYIANRHFLADCQQVWRRGSEVGLEFISSATIK